MSYLEFSRLRAKCKKLSNGLYNNYINNVQSNLVFNIKKFWNYANSRRKSNALPNTMVFDDIVASDPMSVANLFARYFSDVFNRRPIYNQNPSTYDFNTQLNFSNLVLSGHDILSKLRSIDSGKGPDPDGITPYVFKYCSSALVVPLEYLFNFSLTSGVFPSCCKISHVSPFF